MQGVQVLGASQSSGALGPLPGAGGEHVAVAGALVAAARRARGHTVALLAAEAAGPHARAPRPRARPPAPHAALARAEPCSMRVPAHQRSPPVTHGIETDGEQSTPAALKPVTGFMHARTSLLRTRSGVGGLEPRRGRDEQEEEEDRGGLERGLGHRQGRCWCLEGVSFG